MQEQLKKEQKKDESRSREIHELENEKKMLIDQFDKISQNYLSNP